MTVLAEYQRLEAEGLWRASTDAQRRDVIVSIGKATLTITAPNGTALTHWSLPAVIRVNPGEMPALFRPGTDAGETLELDDTEMVEGIDRVLAALPRGRRRARWLGRGARLIIFAAAAAGLVFWLPPAITAYTARLVPDVVQAQIGAKLLGETERLTGAPCRSPAGLRALNKLTDRLFPDGDATLVVLPTTLKSTAHLPGGTILLSHTLVEDHETVDVVAGYALAEYLRAASGKTLGSLLEASPFRASLALLSTGSLRDVDLQRMAEWLVIKPAEPVPEDRLVAAMNARNVATAPYGFAVDISGETTATLVANGPLQSDVILDDTDWIALQAICSE
ncbi:MAG: hypothetical protein AAF718_14755 [Pseudomonadota bacterium]